MAFSPSGGEASSTIFCRAAADVASEVAGSVPNAPMTEAAGSGAA
jgi:hypothetical protein